MIGNDYLTFLGRVCFSDITWMGDYGETFYGCATVGSQKTWTRKNLLDKFVQFFLIFFISKYSKD